MYLELAVLFPSLQSEGGVLREVATPPDRELRREPTVVGAIHHNRGPGQRVGARRQGIPRTTLWPSLRVRQEEGKCQGSVSLHRFAHS
jgi:hypothetical protein